MHRDSQAMSIGVSLPRRARGGRPRLALAGVLALPPPRRSATTPRSASGAAASASAFKVRRGVPARATSPWKPRIG